MSVPAPATYRLHCEWCGRSLPDGEVGEPMELAALLKPSRFSANLPRTHAREHRERCRACTYVNVFHPATSSLLTDSWRDITFKA